MGEKRTLCVLFGGQSSEHEISCLSAAGVLANVDREAFTVLPVGITRDGAWWLYRGAAENLPSGAWETDTENLVAAVLSPCTRHHGLLLFDKARGTYEVCRVDCIFPVMHGESCEDGVLQGLLALSGVPYVGCQTRASAVTMDKITTKQLLEGYGIPQAPWAMIRAEEFCLRAEESLARAEEALGYPMFVKPAGTGSSRGVSRAENRAQLVAAVQCALEFDEKVLLERAISGAEVEVALLERLGADGRRELVASTPGEIVPDGTFYDYDAKYTKGTSVCRVPAEVAPEALALVQKYAVQIFLALECRGLSRADFFVDGQTVVFNEINTLPGFTPISMYPKLFAHDGISYSALITALVDFAMGCTP